MNATAFDVRKKLVERTYLQAFHLKNARFPSIVTNVKKSSKKNLTATVGNVSGRSIDYLTLHAGGGKKRPKGRHLAIPTRHTKRGSKGAVPKGKRPRAILKNKKTFVTSINGSKVVAQRKGKNRYPIKVKYLFAKEGKINKSLRFYESAKKVVDKTFQKNFSKAFLKAIQTAR